MATQRNKNPELQMTKNDILDRMFNGRVVDTWEMYDRLMLYQQLQLFVPMQRKQNSTRVR